MRRFAAALTGGRGESSTTSSSTAPSAAPVACSRDTSLHPSSLTVVPASEILESLSHNRQTFLGQTPRDIIGIISAFVRPLGRDGLVLGTSRPSLWVTDLQEFFDATADAPWLPTRADSPQVEPRAVELHRRLFKSIDYVANDSTFPLIATHCSSTELVVVMRSSSKQLLGLHYRPDLPAGKEIRKIEVSSDFGASSIQGSALPTPHMFAWFGGGNGETEMRKAIRVDTSRDEPVWQSLATLPTGAGRTCCAAALLPTEVQVAIIGGYSDRWSTVSSVLLYDAFADQYFYAPPLRSARGRHKAAVIGGCVGVAGGSDGGTYHASLELYDARENQWRGASSMSIARGGPAVMALDDNQFFVCGGNGRGKVANSAEIYDIRNDKWERPTSTMAVEADNIVIWPLQPR